MNLTIPQLRRYPLFAGLSDIDLLNVAKQLTLKRFESHKVILHQNEVPAYVVIVVSGQIQASIVNEEGRVVSISFFGTDETIGWECVVDRMPLAQSLTTTKITDLLLVPNQLATNLLQDPWVAAEVLRTFTKTIRRLNDEHRVLGLPNAFQRVYSQILQLTTREDNTNPVTQLPKQQEIAVMVNTSRETVSRALQVLIKQGVLVKSGQQILIQNAERLRQLALEGSEK